MPRLLPQKQDPSMEGRTIVRPDSVSAEDPSFGFFPSMEGRTIVRPDFGPRRRSGQNMAPSMEGRTIVRPDVYIPRAPCQPTSTFNGGPDNRPARPGSSIASPAPGNRSFNGGPDNRPARQRNGQRVTPPAELFPSMEGRTIVRPDVAGVSGAGPVGSAFNGGPDNRPARPA